MKIVSKISVFIKLPNIYLKIALMKQITIYALSSSKEPNNIRYVGKLKERLNRHISSSKYEKTRKANWIRKELKSGNNILIKEVFIVPKNDDWKKWEIHFISEHKKLGYNLTNSTKGGESLSGNDNPFFNKKHTEESIQKNKDNQPYSKEINKYDLVGNLLKTYKSIREASLDTNLSNTSIYDVCHHRPKCKTAGGYVWRLKGESFSLEYLNSAEHLRKSICQYDKKGKLLKEFASLSQASEKTGISVGNISRCCNKNIKTIGGYVWRFKGESFSYEKTRNDAKKVIQFTLSGAFIKEYSSILEAAEKTGVYYTGIYFCCKEKYKNAGGFKWKFA